jgi:glutathione-specific gamma-glutamylcyclotransferase
MSQDSVSPQPAPITRDQLLNPERWREMVGEHLRDEVRSDEELGRSLAHIMKGHPPDRDVWVFAYGSLIWNPTFAHVEHRIGRIRGYHRRFCLRADVGRGSPERPGLFLGLDRGGQSSGVVFRIAAADAPHELMLLWRRELITNSYIPRWVRTVTAEGPVRAIAMVINHANARYAGSWPEERVIEAIATAEGRLGRCSDYLFNTLDHLTEMGIRDRMLERMAAAVRRYQAANRGETNRPHRGD